MITIRGHRLLHKTLLFHENPEPEQILRLSTFLIFSLRNPDPLLKPYCRVQ